jgi:hypothetical protein
MNTNTIEDNNLSLNKQFPEHEKYTNWRCSGRECTRIAKNHLMIFYIKKTGYFCDKCTHDLLAAELAVRLPEVFSTD